MLRNLMIVLGILMPAGLHAAEVAPPLRTWLHALESVPTPAQLQHAGGAHLEADLDAVVHDGRETGYARHRALSFLGILPTATATARLRKDLRLPDPELRATAAVAWAAGPGRREPAKAMIELDKLLDDKVPAVRAAAARGLLFVADPKLARDHAARQRGREQVPEVLQALDHTLRQLDARAK
jgi:hypothetical protein